MIKELFQRLRQGHRTSDYPHREPTLPDRLRGLPHLDPSRCPPGCALCTMACPTEAISRDEGLRLDLGRCLFCTDCTAICPTQAITFTTDYRLATSDRAALVLDGVEHRLGVPVEQRIRRLFGRSLKLRQVSAGGCNACEADTNVLATVGFDLGRFGIQFVASPRHADGLLVTGPVTGKMRTALQKTYEAVPQPRIVIAVGGCAITGGPFAGLEQVHDGLPGILPVDLYIPGCPPHPMTILDGLLRLVGRIEEQGRG